MSRKGKGPRMPWWLKTTVVYQGSAVQHPYDAKGFAAYEEEKAKRDAQLQAAVDAGVLTVHPFSVPTELQEALQHHPEVQADIARAGLGNGALERQQEREAEDLAIARLCALGESEE